MKKISRRSFLAASGILAASAALTACGGSGSAASSTSSSASPAASAAGSGEHAPITIMDANRDYTALMELVHETYPEINLQIEAYKGRNTTGYMKKQLVTGSFPDIYCTSQAWDDELLENNLIDLSQYPISELYNPVRLNELDVNGATYLLPFDFVISGVLCNRSLLERLGLEVPSSFTQLRDEVIPKLREAGVEIAECAMNYPGYPFQYFFNVSDTGFMNTRNGKQWRKDFLAGNTTANANESMRSCADYFQEWIDAGLINFDRSTDETQALADHFHQGNTAFMFGSVSSFTQNEDGTGDQYAFIPYLSVDGSQNVYITQNGRCYGLNKKLAEPGNEQKLEDALHVLEVLSTNKGYATVFGSIKDFSLPETSPYYDAMVEVNAGHGAPLVYTGWEDYIVPFGNAILDWVQGNGTAESALLALDDKQAEVLANGTTYYANVTEELDTEQAAVLCGQMFLSADTGADAALISYNIYQPEVLSNLENGYGANGRILTGEMSEEDIVIFLPTGWSDTLQTITLTGAELRQMAADGCDLRDNGYPYPYVLMTKDGKDVDDDAEYTVILCGIPKVKKDELDLQDTGVVGLDAAKAYLLDVGEVSHAMLKTDWVKN